MTTPERKPVDDPQDIAVVGGGMAGLLAALFLARDGHHVTVYERDDTGLPATADEAFDHWNRRGAPHARQSHALLARLRALLKERAPDVIEALLQQGATELSVERLLPPTIEDRAPRPGDDELVLLACRRLTIEWVLRRVALAEANVTWRGGAVVEGLLADGTDVRGIRVAGSGSASDGPATDRPTTDRPTTDRPTTDRPVTDVEADLVVLSGGRSSLVMDWVAALGGAVAPTEEEQPAGIVYLSRFYRLRPDKNLPVLNERGVGGDLGYVAFAGFYGDNRTFSVTVGVPSADRELQFALRDPAAWEAAIATFVPLQPWTETGLADPISDVESMARLRNRIRRFVVDGEPVVTGLVTVGDAAVATNPWYGKGCSTAGIAAAALADGLREHGRDRVGLAKALDAAVTAELEPHYALACRQDRDRTARQAAKREGTEPDPKASATRDFIVNGLLPATRLDPDVFRAFFRSFNMLDAPDALMSDEKVMQASLAAHAAKDERPPEPRSGPERDALMAAMSAAVEAVSGR